MCDNARHGGEIYKLLREKCGDSKQAGMLKSYLENNV